MAEFDREGTKNLRGKRSPDTKAAVAAPVEGGDPETTGRVEAVRIDEPGTPAKDMASTVATCRPGRAIPWCAGVIAMVAIFMATLAAKKSK